MFKLEDIENNETVDLKVNVLWNDNSDNDLSDSVLGSNIGEDVYIPVTIRFLQYDSNDIINEYVEDVVDDSNDNLDDNDEDSGDSDEGI